MINDAANSVKAAGVERGRLLQDILIAFQGRADELFGICGVSRYAQHGCHRPYVDVILAIQLSCTVESRMRQFQEHNCGDVKEVYESL